MGSQARSGNAKELEVVLQEPILVYPQAPTPRQRLYLSLLDRQAPLFMYTLYFYNRGESTDVFHQLKQAMEKNLVAYYPAAGRIQYNAKSGEPEINCSEEGVMLVEASTDAKIADLGDMRDVNLQFEKFVYRIAPAPENPLVVCQVTQCGCGGFVIGFGSRHELFDGLSALQFLADWASLARGTPLQEIQIPCHDRELLRPKPSRFTPSELEKLFMERFEGIPLFRRSKTNSKSSWESTVTKFATMDTRPRYVTKVFSISDEMISCLKAKAMEGDHLSHCSTFDVLTAHAWLARIKAIELDPSERVLLEFTVNGRPKTVPPLPDNFAGNAFIMAYSNFNAADILNAPFYSVVKIVQEAKASVTDSFIWDSINMLEVVDTKALPSFRETTIVADWTKIPLHLLDFGWGPTVFATPVAMPLLDVIFLLRDGLDQGKICLRLGLLPQVMNKFEKYFHELLSADIMFKSSPSSSVF